MYIQTIPSNKILLTFHKYVIINLQLHYSKKGRKKRENLC